CLGEGQEIDWIGHTEYSETRIEQLDHIFNLIGISRQALRLQDAFSGIHAVLLFGDLQDPLNPSKHSY
ncbi:hypothetical protein ACSZNS_19110, partial [Aeromonas caviae]